MVTWSKAVIIILPSERKSVQVTSKEQQTVISTYLLFGECDQLGHAAKHILRVAIEAAEVLGGHLFD